MVPTGLPMGGSAMAGATWGGSGLLTSRDGTECLVGTEPASCWSALKAARSRAWLWAVSSPVPQRRYGMKRSTRTPATSTTRPTAIRTAVNDTSGC